MNQQLVCQKLRVNNHRTGNCRMLNMLNMLNIRRSYSVVFWGRTVRAELSELFIISRLTGRLSTGDEL